VSCSPFKLNYTNEIIACLSFIWRKRADAERLAYCAEDGSDLVERISWMVQYPQGRAFKEYAKERAKKLSAIS